MLSLHWSYKGDSAGFGVLVLPLRSSRILSMAASISCVQCAGGRQDSSWATFGHTAPPGYLPQSSSRAEACAAASNATPCNPSWWPSASCPSSGCHNCYRICAHATPSSAAVDEEGTPADTTALSTCRQHATGCSCCSKRSWPATVAATSLFCP